MKKKADGESGWHTDLIERITYYKQKATFVHVLEISLSGAAMRELQRCAFRRGKHAQTAAQRWVGEKKKQRLFNFLNFLSLERDK